MCLVFPSNYFEHITWCAQKYKDAYLFTLLNSEKIEFFNPTELQKNCTNKNCIFSVPICKQNCVLESTKNMKISFLDFIPIF